MAILKPRGGDYHGRVLVLFHPSTGCVVTSVAPEHRYYLRAKRPLGERVTDEWRFAVTDSGNAGIQLAWTSGILRVVPVEGCVGSIAAAGEVGVAAAERFKNRYLSPDYLSLPGRRGEKVFSLKTVFDKEFLRSQELSVASDAITLESLELRPEGWLVEFSGANEQVGAIELDRDWNVLSAKGWSSREREKLLWDYPPPGRTERQLEELAEIQEVSARGWASVLSWREGGFSPEERTLLARLSAFASLDWDQVPSPADTTRAREIMERVEAAERSDLLYMGAAP